MQKGGMLNSSIAKVLADLGHTDTIVIGEIGRASCRERV